MTNRSNDDIANALRGLTGGEHADADAGGHEAAQPAVPTQGVPVPPPVPAPLPASPRTAPPAMAARVPAAPKPVQSKPLAPPRPARPMEPGAGPAPQRAAAPGGSGVGRPPAPLTPPVSHAPGVMRAPAPGAPSAFKVPPAAVAPPAAFPQRVPAPGSEPTAAGEFVQNDAAEGFDEDDAMNMPAPSAEYLAHVVHPTPHPKRPASGRASGLRDTLIPVLLTAAVLMLAAAVLKFVVHPDAPLAAMPAWLALILAAGALAFAGVAVVYVTQARRGNTAAAPVGEAAGRTT